MAFCRPIEWYFLRMWFSTIMAILATIVSIRAFAEGPHDDPSSQWPSLPISRHIAKPHQEGDLSPIGQSAQFSPTARIVNVIEVSRSEIPPVALPPVVDPRVETLPVEPWLLPPPLPTSDQVKTPASSFNTLPFPTGSSSKRQLTLAETVRLGLEHNKDVVVLSFDPSIEATTVDTAKSLYDPVSGATAWGGQSDVQVRSLIQTFGAPADFLETDFLQPFQQPNNIYTKRRLYSGGEVELGFSTNYENFFPVGPQLIVNPGWDSAVNFRYDQPLFAGRGEDFTTAPIRIAQANQNQAQSEFMAEIRTLTRDIELAYWELAGADLALEAYESFLARGKEIFENQLKREKLGTSALPDVLQAKNLLEEFEIEVADQRQRRDVAEDNLRQIMGLPAQGDRSWFASNGDPSLLSLPLAAVENTSAYDLELPWEEYVRMAEQRPEILAQQSAIRAARISVSLAQNQLLPDVSARANYSVNGLDENLADSIATIGRHEFNTWSVGLIYERPFGMRAQHAALRRAKLTLVQESTKLDKIRHDILHALRRSEDITRSANAIYELRKKRVETAKAQMEAFDALYLEGRASLFIRLNSEQNLADARAEAAQAWTRRQLAVVQRNYEANIVSPTFQVDFTSPTCPAEQPAGW